MNCTTVGAATRSGWRWSKDARRKFRARLLENLALKEDDLFIIDGPVNPVRLAAITEGDHSPELRDPPFVAPVAGGIARTYGFVRSHPRARHPAASPV